MNSADFWPVNFTEHVSTLIDPRYEVAGLANLDKISTCEVAECRYRSRVIDVKILLDKHMHIWEQLAPLLNKQRKRL